MEKKILKKLLAVLMIIMLMATDFFVLGSNLISYAASLDNSTDNENIEFSAYFKNEAGERVDSITESIKKEGLKLYAEIKVKNEGYFNGAIELQESNFKIKNNILSKSITSIEGNKVNLNQINAGSTVEIELDIEPIISETISADMLSKQSTVKLTGKYMETTYKGLDIEATKTITANLQVDEGAQAELVTSIITNKIYSINGENKRLVQLLIKSRLTENQYPIKQTTLNVNVPQLSDKAPEEVKVLSLGTLATNGKTELSAESWKNENGIVQITLKNDANENNEITWNKNVYDEVVVTFVYSEDVDATKVEIETNSEILVYNSESKFTGKHIKEITNKELAETIKTEIEVNPTEMYKGQLYENAKSETGKSIEYNTKTTLQITNKDVVDQIIIHEGPDSFMAEATEMAVSTKYLKTEINKEKMLAILGDTAQIQIKAGETTQTITKDTEANESGNIVIEYGETEASVLDITFSKPAKEGMLDIHHVKEITASSKLTTEQIKTVKTLKVTNSVEGKLAETKLEENFTETSMELKETISKAELTVNKENLSTTMTNEGVILGVKLITDDVKYDLYKNPTIKIQLPSSVESVDVKGIDPLYAEDFQINAGYNTATKVIDIKLTGEQLKYPETQAVQLYLQIRLDITLSKLAASKTDKITLTYTNDNASQYEGGTTDNGIVEKAIGISAPSGLVTMFDLGTNDNAELNQAILQQISSEDAGKDINFNISLINNTETDISNVRIFGKLPTDGNTITGEEKANTLKTTLKSIAAQNATIYYSENVNATTDVDDTTNGWTTSLAGLTNPKVYLIKLDTLSVGSNFTGTCTVQLPNPITRDTASYTEYKVIYDTETEKDITVSSRKIGFTTPTEVKIETTLTAEVGNDKLNNGDTVKAGEVIKYKVTVKNTGAQEIKNIQLKAGVPEGTVVVQPKENYVYSGISYYDEKADITEMSVTVPTLAAGQTYTAEYEVRVKTDITSGAQIANKATATCDDATVESSEITAKLETAKVRVTIKRIIDLKIQLYPGGTTEYLAFVENLTNEVLTNYEMELVSDNFKTASILNDDINLYGKDVPEKITINEIPANGVAYFMIYGDIVQKVDQLNTTAIAKDSTGAIYRANQLTEIFPKTDAKITLSSPQDKAYIKEGDIVEYNITVENTGDIDEFITIKDNIPEYLDIQEVSSNGEIQMQTTDSNNGQTFIESISNDLDFVINVSKGKNEEAKILAKVKYITENFDAKNISNKAEAVVNNEVKSTSEEVTHILRGPTIADLKNVISGSAWLDQNVNGQKDSDETALSGIKVRLYDVSTNDYYKNDNGDIVETTTDNDGQYTFTRIKDGSYIILFEYDMEKYEPTKYAATGVDTSRTSKAVLKKININGEEKTLAVTDTINLQDNISSMNIGLKEKFIFDLELNKYINRIVVQNNKGTKAYDCGDSKFEKIEINSKQLKGSVVVLEYVIKIKNNGELAGYAKNIVDYLPSGLTFSSELNKDWYLSGNYLYTKGLENTKINPGEEKEIKLILTKTMTEQNTGLINNRAEIYEDYNEYGNVDIDSTPNNQAKGEDDLGSVDVIIGPSTGGTTIAYIMLIMINTVLIFIAIRLMIKNNIIKINTKKERR